MGNKKLDKKTLQSLHSPPKLTEKQAEVLSLILNEYLDPVSISKRLQTSRQNIYQIIAKIRKKGHLSTQNFNALQKATHIKLKSKIWSYHGLHFLVDPYYFYPRYHKYRLDNGNYGIQFGDWVFKLHKESIEVQSKHLVEFCDRDKFKAIGKAEVSFNKALIQASSRFGFEVFKEGKANIRLKNHHLEFQGSDVAKGSKEHYLRIRNNEGKTWFMFDMSKGSLNHEYTREVVSDSERLEPFFNDIRGGGWDDIKLVVGQVVNGLRVVGENHNRQFEGYSEELANHRGAIDDMRSGVKALTKAVSCLNKEIMKLNKK